MSKQENQLFNRLKKRGVFWSYSKDITYEKAGKNLTIEYMLKYGDFKPDR